MDYSISDFYSGGIRDFELASAAFSIKHGLKQDEDKIETESDLDDLYSRIGG